MPAVEDESMADKDSKIEEEVDNEEKVDNKVDSHDSEMLENEGVVGDKEKEKQDEKLSGESRVAPLSNKKDTYNKMEMDESGDAEEDVDDVEMTDGGGDSIPPADADPLTFTTFDVDASKMTLSTETMSEEVLEKLRESLADRLLLGNDALRGQELWKKYDALTRDLSIRLCEQLRLILEPSLMSKLKGDYKSGKRINMRKVISFIASQYRKDKIWLRRTKPNKRTYQVVLAVDDSVSMARSRGGAMACEAMTVLAKAMTQLEVGEMAVASFGEEVKLLHALETPFTPDAGARVLSQFTFAQERTNYTDAISSLMLVLDSARANSRGGSDQLQLIFLISDGLIDDSGREKVRQLARTAAFNGQLLVMLLLDQPAEGGHSILDMQQVKYVGGGIKFTKYLDDYPFNFYIILKNLSALPETLADAMRQWFELVNQSR
jgi:midasin